MPDKPRSSDLSLFIEAFDLGQATADFWAAVKQAARHKARHLSYQG